MSQYQFQGTLSVVYQTNRVLVMCMFVYCISGVPRHVTGTIAHATTACQINFMLDSNFY